MIDQKIEELYQTILHTNTYLEYQKIKEALRENKEILNLIDEIKNLQKQATKLEYNKNSLFKEIDEKIITKKELLNSFPLYNQYCHIQEELNDILTNSSNMLEKYFNEKI